MIDEGKIVEFARELVVAEDERKPNPLSNFITPPQSGTCFHKPSQNRGYLS